MPLQEHHSKLQDTRNGGGNYGASGTRLPDEEPPEYAAPIRGTAAEMSPPRVDLSTYTDKKLFARARVERATFRRYACYGVAVYAPIAMLPLVLGVSMSPAGQVLCAVTGVLGVAAWLSVSMRFASPSIRGLPRVSWSARPCV